MTTQLASSIKGDRALHAGDEDKLGFRDVAARIALSLVDHASDNGLVVGIEGTWGSGKSSLVYLIEEELCKLPDEQRPTVINFRPWLIGNRDALIRSLFSELSKQLDQIALSGGDAKRISVTKAKEAGKALRKFAQGISKAGAAVEFVGELSGVKPLSLIGKIFSILGKSTEGESVEPQLSDLKESLINALKLLGHRFIIIIDDVDRLEPAEVIEVLRLTRSVADFPNVVYLMCYDSKILWHSIEQAAKVESGQAYLEKIVQLTVMVPQPEPLQLRQ
jgi:predicted KAP-like P-loop ATPase